VWRIDLCKNGGFSNISDSSGSSGVEPVDLAVIIVAHLIVTAYLQ
jgi:hypothetical protein